jgi:hypothetical protein
MANNLAWGSVTYHENIGATCFIIMRCTIELPSNLANVIEDQFYQRWKMLITDLHYAGAFPNPYLLGEARLHDDVDAKEA